MGSDVLGSFRGYILVPRQANGRTAFQNSSSSSSSPPFLAAEQLGGSQGVRRENKPSEMPGA